MAIIQIWIKKCPHQSPTLQQLMATLEIPVTECIWRATTSGTTGRTLMRSGHKYCQVLFALLWKKAFICTVSGQKRKSFNVFKASRITCYDPLCERGDRYDNFYCLLWKSKFLEVSYFAVFWFHLSILYALPTTDEWMNVSQLYAWLIEFQCILQNFHLCKDCCLNDGGLSQVGGYKSVWGL